MLNGFINIYKPKGITSNKVIGILKYKLKQNNIDTKIGHFGTLDPLAEGVLPVALGRATRLFDYSLEKRKVYVASFLFGKSTTTLDIDGEVTDSQEVDISENDIINVLPQLTGEINQLPPNYSAKSVNGVKAYKLARQGVEFELVPKKIIIYSIELLQKIDKNIFSFRIECSGGTYVRSIARDMGIKLGTFGIMTELKRSQSGFFNDSNSVLLDDFDIAKDILPIETALTDYPIVQVPTSLEKLLFNGVKLHIDNLPDGNFAVKVSENLIGIGYRNESDEMVIKTWLL